MKEACVRGATVGDPAGGRDPATPSVAHNISQGYDAVVLLAAGA